MTLLSNKALIGHINGTQTSAMSLIKIISKFIKVNETYNNTINSNVANVLSGISANMVDGQESYSIVDNNIRIRVYRTLLSTVNLLTLPLSDAELLYKKSNRLSINFEDVRTIEELDNGNNYVEISLTQWDKNPFHGSALLEAPQFTIQTKARNNRPSSMTAAQNNIYYVSFQLDTNLRNDFLPACTNYNPQKDEFSLNCPGCAVVSYNDTTVQFGCSDINQLLLGSDDGIDVSFTSIHYGVFVSTVQNTAAFPNAINVQRSKAIIALVSILFAIMILGCFYYRRADYYKKSVCKKKQYNHDVTTNNEIESTKDHLKRLLKIIERSYKIHIFPSARFKKYYSYLNLITDDEKDKVDLSGKTNIDDSDEIECNQLNVWLSFCVKYLSIMFVNTLFFGIFFSDDGTCQHYTNKVDCKTPINKALGSKQCIWTADGKCILNPPPDSLMFTLIVIVLITIAALPIHVFLDHVLKLVRRRPKLSLWGWNENFWLYSHPSLSEPLDLEDFYLSCTYSNVFASSTDTIDAAEVEMLIEIAKKYLEENYMNGYIPWDQIRRIDVKRKINIIEEYLGISRDGTIMPLSIIDFLRYGTYQVKLYHRIKEVCLILSSNLFYLFTYVILLSELQSIYYNLFVVTIIIFSFSYFK